MPENTKEISGTAEITDITKRGPHKIREITKITGITEDHRMHNNNGNHRYHKNHGNHKK